MNADQLQQVSDALAQMFAVSDGAFSRLDIMRHPDGSVECRAEIRRGDTRCNGYVPDPEEAVTLALARFQKAAREEQARREGIARTPIQDHSYLDEFRSQDTGDTWGT